jgi:hypothetical protein
MNKPLCLQQYLHHLWLLSNPKPISESGSIRLGRYINIILSVQFLSVSICKREHVPRTFWHSYQNEQNTLAISLRKHFIVQNVNGTEVGSMVTKQLERRLIANYFFFDLCIGFVLSASEIGQYRRIL